MKNLKKIFQANQKFFLLWLAQILTQSAVSISTIIIGILSHEGTISSALKESSASIGVIVDLSTLPGLLVAPIAGCVADKFDKKKIIIYSDVIRFFLLAVFTFFYGWQNMWLSYLLVFVLSIILQFFIPAEGGIIPQIVKKEYLIVANSLFSLTVYSTMAVGVAFSGLFLNTLGVKNTFIVCSILFITSSILIRFVKIEKEEKKSSKLELIPFLKSMFHNIRGGVSHVLNHSKLRFALTHLFLIQIVGLTLVTIVFRIGEEIYGVSPRNAGLVVFAPLGMGLLAGVVCLNTIVRKRNRIKLILLGTFLSSIGFSLMAFISIYDGILTEGFLGDLFANLSLFSIGLSMPFLLIPGQTLMHENTEDRFRGRILGIWVALTSSLASIFATFVGLVTDIMGNISFTVIFIVFADLAYSVIIMYLLKKKSL